MWATNLKILGVTIGTIALYTLVANVIPQIESEVPEDQRDQIEERAEAIAAMALSPDGKTVALGAPTSFSGPAVSVQDADTGRERARTLEDGRSVNTPKVIADSGRDLLQLRRAAQFDIVAENAVVRGDPH